MASLPDNSKVLQYRRLKGTGTSHLALIERNGVLHYLNLSTGSGLSADVRASGPKAKVVFQQDLNNLLSGAEGYGVATLEQNKIDAAGEKAIQAFWSPFLGIDWESLTPENAEEDMEAFDFHKILRKQINSWLGGSPYLGITKHSYYPTFKRMVESAIGTMPKIYRGVYGDYAEAILKGAHMEVRELASWTTDRSYAQNVAIRSSTGSSKNRIWCVAQAIKYKLKDVVFAPVILPDYKPNPNVLLDAFSKEDEYVIHDPSQILKRGDFKVAVKTKSTLVQRLASRYKDKKVSDKGNTIYMYSEGQVSRRNNEKAKRLEDLRKNVSKVRAQVKKDLASGDPEKVLTALAVGLLDHTAERVGNKDSAKDGHFGVTGWQKDHVKFSGGKATVSYVGKSGVKQKKVVSDKALVRALKDASEACEEGDLFCHEVAKVDASKVNKYLKKFEITAKDLRGLHANQAMQNKLKAVRKGTLPTDPKERKALLKEEFKKALEETASEVGHEPATLRSQYLVPNLENEYMSGRVMTKMVKESSEKMAYRIAFRHIEKVQK